MRKFTLVSRRARWLVRWARWSLLAVFCVAVLNACANRGMMTPTPSGTGGSGDDAGTGGTGGDMGTGGSGGGTGGIIGTGGSGGGVVDSGPDTLADAVDARDATADHSCSPAAMFTFEAGVQGARLGAMQGGAKSITNSTADHYCGTRALEITTGFSGTSGNTTKGEVFIDLAAAQQNLTGKTITIHVAAVPEPMPSAYLSLTLTTGSGSIDLKPSIRQLTSDWQTQSYPLTGTDGGLMMVMNLDIQIFDTNGYSGKIYIDDIDIR